MIAPINHLMRLENLLQVHAAVCQFLHRQRLALAAFQVPAQATPAELAKPPLPGITE